jgi:hypothetical protein
MDSELLLSSKLHNNFNPNSVKMGKEKGQNFSQPFLLPLPIISDIYQMDLIYKMSNLSNDLKCNALNSKVCQCPLVAGSRFCL